MKTADRTDRRRRLGVVATWDDLWRYKTCATFGIVDRRRGPNGDLKRGYIRNQDYKACLDDGQLGNLRTQEGYLPLQPSALDCLDNICLAGVDTAQSTISQAGYPSESGRNGQSQSSGRPSSSSRNVVGRGAVRPARGGASFGSLIIPPRAPEGVLVRSVLRAEEVSFELALLSLEELKASKSVLKRRREEKSQADAAEELPHTRVFDPVSRPLSAELFSPTVSKHGAVVGGATGPGTSRVSAVKLITNRLAAVATVDKHLSLVDLETWCPIFSCKLSMEVFCLEVGSHSNVWLGLHAGVGSFDMRCSELKGICSPLKEPVHHDVISISHDTLNCIFTGGSEGKLGIWDFRSSNITRQAIQVSNIPIASLGYDCRAGECLSGEGDSASCAEAQASTASLMVKSDCITRFKQSRGAWRRHETFTSVLCRRESGSQSAFLPRQRAWVTTSDRGLTIVDTLTARPITWRWEVSQAANVYYAPSLDVLLAHVPASKYFSIIHPKG